MVQLHGCQIFSPTIPVVRAIEVLHASFAKMGFDKKKKNSQDLCQWKRKVLLKTQKVKDDTLQNVSGTYSFAVYDHNSSKPKIPKSLENSPKTLKKYIYTYTYIWGIYMGSMLGQDRSA